MQRDAARERHSPACQRAAETQELARATSQQPVRDAAAGRAPMQRGEGVCRSATSTRHGSWHGSRAVASSMSHDLAVALHRQPAVRPLIAHHAIYAQGCASSSRIPQHTQTAVPTALAPSRLMPILRMCLRQTTTASCQRAWAGSEAMA